jgi:hypothetical protein
MLLKKALKADADLSQAGSEHIVRKQPRSVKLQGLLGKPQVAQYADLAFQLQTDKGREGDHLSWISAGPGCSFLRRRKS